MNDSNFENPYAEEEPQPNSFGLGGLSALDKLTGVASEQTRRKHLAHEASIKAVGVLYLLGVVVGVVNSISILIEVGAEVASDQFFFLLLFALLFGIAISFYALASWTRRLGSVLIGIWILSVPVLAGIGTLSFSLGILFNGYALYLLLSKKGGMVFSAYYKKVIRETPHIKYRASIDVWIQVGLLVTVLLVIFAVAVG